MLFFSCYTANLFLNIPLLSLPSQSSGVGGTKHLLPPSRCCLVGPGVSGARDTQLGLIYLWAAAPSPFPCLSQRIWGFCPGTAPSVPGRAGMSSEERQGAQHQLWGGFGFLGAGEGLRRIPSPKGLAELELPLPGQKPWTPSLGTKGMTKAGFYLHGAKQEKSSLVGRAWDNALGCAG